MGSDLFSTRAFLLFLISIFSLIVFASGQLSYLYSSCGSETPDGDYKTNLTSLLDSQPSKASTYTFYNDTLNQIYSLYLCRGDVNATTCQSCVKTAGQEIQEQCQYNKTAIIWYDECMLRYSNEDFIGTMNTSPGFLMYNVNNRTDSGERDVGALSLMDQLRGETPYSELMFQTDERPSTDNASLILYGLAQCTRDINTTSCYNCLFDLSSMIQECCQEKVGWRALGPNCNIRYERYRFYADPASPAPAQLPPPPPPTAEPPPPDNPGGEGNNTIKIAIITVSAITGAAVVLGFFLYFSFFSRKSRRGEQKSEEILLNVLDRPTGTHFMEGHMHDQDNTVETYYFNLTTILAATNNFSDYNKLGEGGFGPVYKGKLLDGREIAVKRLSTKSGQGLEEFKNEVMLIVKLQHKNLVRLLGCCMEGDEKLLVYEYMANTSLDAFLFDPTKCKELDWDKRAAIVRGIARGILYLHEDSRLKIIHRDLKASNVLLDEEMNAKISDFGTARIFGSKQLDANTNRVVGTFGYMAPEYAMEGLFSVKSDTYSFGVLLLEILSGKKNSGLYSTDHSQNLLSHAWQLWNEDKGLEFIDRNLVDKCPVSEAVRWIHIALLCVQEDPNDRPPMSSVALMLGSKWVNLPQPSAPPFSVGRSFMSDLSSTSGSGLGFLISDQSSTSASV
ncbi:cysteine-rich receptor-like protein kinase 10 [Vitis riparia]|uniref:cysteine-rich receptor-like protein kinase 10 n=1 Tax=Vitis riparia TaxID=96939 RepID=UPI00155ACEFD|nr:cysteine-rich receptor-like protein kinase 10 [Vitis riparia]